jgi:hypothetical protein
MRLVVCYEFLVVRDCCDIFECGGVGAGGGDGVGCSDGAVRTLTSASDRNKIHTSSALQF